MVIVAIATIAAVAAAAVVRCTRTALTKAAVVISVDVLFPLLSSSSWSGDYLVLLLLHSKYLLFKYASFERPNDLMVSR